MDISDRTLTPDRTREDHHADEVRRTIAPSLRKDRIATALEPRPLRLDPKVMAERVDADTAALQTANAGTLMRMGIGDPAGRKINPVATHQVVDAWLDLRFAGERQFGRQCCAAERLRLAGGQLPAQQASA